VGGVIPYAQFAPWVAEHGLDLRLMWSELFSMRIAFIRSEGAQRKVRLLWLPVAATCLVGVSCGLPLFLYLRERMGSADLR
jgi:hypothetical protein